MLSIDPASFRLRRDKAPDNSIIVRKARILSTQSIRVRQQFATVTAFGPATVDMPYNGTITMGFPNGHGFTFLPGMTIRNPFFTPSTPVTIDAVNAAGAANPATVANLTTAIIKESGQFRIRTGATEGFIDPGGSVTISVGSRR